MAILKGFPPSNTISPTTWISPYTNMVHYSRKPVEHYCRPLTDEEQIIFKNYLWQTRNAVIKWKEIDETAKSVIEEIK